MSHLLQNNKVLLIFPHAPHASVCVSRNSYAFVFTTISHINWALTTCDELGKIFHMHYWYLIILTIGLGRRGSYSLYFIDENTNVWKGMFPLLGSHKTQPPDSRTHVLNHLIDVLLIFLYTPFSFIFRNVPGRKEKTQNTWGDFQRYAKCKIAQKDEGKIRLRLELGPRKEENVRLCLAWWFLAANAKMGILSSLQCTVSSS